MIIFRDRLLSLERIGLNPMENRVQLKFDHCIYVRAINHTLNIGFCFNISLHTHTYSSILIVNDDDDHVYDAKMRSKRDKI